MSNNIWETLLRQNVKELLFMEIPVKMKGL